MKAMRLDKPQPQPRPRPILLAPLVAIAVSHLSLTGVAGRESNPQEPDRTFRAINNIVLVDEASADGSRWAEVIPMLSSRGMHAVAVQNHSRSFEEDVDTTRRAIAAQNGPVLLVGHSYGGAVITQAGDDPKVAGLVYVAAYAPEVGESATAASAMTITSAAWKIKPCWYLLAENDRALPPHLQQLFATRMKATTLSLPTSHAPMLSRPYDVAAFIRSAAGQPD
jgi:pimeloyl-ACP methyl ester carboxylesterase